MKKLLKAILIIVILFFITLFSISYALKPTDSIENDQRLWHVENNLNPAVLNKDIVKNIRLEGDKLSTIVYLDNDMLNKVLKYALSQAGNPSIQEMAFSLKGNHLVVKTPVMVGIWKSQIDVYMLVKSENNLLILTVDNAKLGKIKLPNSLVSRKLKGTIGKDSEIVKTNGKNVYIKFKAPNVNLDSASIDNSVIKLGLSLSKENLTKLGNNILGDIIK